MKNCPNCQSEVPQEFDLCWKCNYGFIEERTHERKEPNTKVLKEIYCL
jgi:hypothetical protein